MSFAPGPGPHRPQASTGRQLRGWGPLLYRARTHIPHQVSDTFGPGVEPPSDRELNLREKLILIYRSPHLSSPSQDL